MGGGPYGGGGGGFNPGMAAGGGGGGGRQIYVSNVCLILPYPPLSLALTIAVSTNRN
jgi:hypothetical protein